MPSYLYDNGNNLESCIINGLELHKMGFDVNLESDLEDYKGVNLTETAGIRTIPQMSGKKSLTKFTLSFKYGVEPYNFWGQKQPMITKFEAQRKVLNELYYLNEPLDIQLKDLEDFGISKMIMLSRTITPYELYEEVYIECVEYSISHYKVQSSISAEEWYVNTLDNSDLQSILEEELNLIGGNVS